jgi:hypothetical protein
MDGKVAQRESLDDFGSIGFREMSHFEHGGLLRP